MEVQALDTGPRLDRVWRLSRALGPTGIRLDKPLPYEPRRPVRFSLRLPDEDPSEWPEPLSGVGRVRSEDTIEFTSLEESARRRILLYVQERTLIP